MRLRTGLMILSIVAALLPASALAENAEPGGWSIAAGGGVQALESWSNGSQGVLTLARHLPYRHPDTPLSSIAFEAEITRSIEPMTRRRNGPRHEKELTTAGFYLAHNTFITERVFHRARFGAVYRYMERDTDSSISQGRIAFGLGLGVAVVRNLELVADAGLHYWGGDPLLYTAAVSARVRF